MADEIQYILSVNQIVAFNLRRAREAKGWTQVEASTALFTYLGDYWSRQRLSAAERAYSGETDREFSVNELIAFSRAFSLPLSYFLTPPPLTMQAYTGKKAWLIFYEDDAETPLVWHGSDPEKASPGRPIQRVSGPEYPDSMPALELLGLLGSAEAPLVAARLRALADELERQK